MATFKVIWEIDIEADSPEQAAKIAREIQLDTESTATIFTVEDEEGNMSDMIDVN